MKRVAFLIILLGCFSYLPSFAKQYYMALNGSDANQGTIDAPFATLRQAQKVMNAGDTLYIREGVYKVSIQQVMRDDGHYLRVYNLTKSGNKKQRICYFGYPGERPVFDFSEVKHPRRRVSAFHISGEYLHLRNFEIVGVQVFMKGHTQSECITIRGGNNNIIENIAMHDGMAIGCYLINGSDNLILNCDAFCNYDNYSEGEKGGNVDGFGAHMKDMSHTGNVFRGCRAWWNSDDGFDLINCRAAVVIEDCWSFYNGYQPNTLRKAGDGTGFKAGGYGMKREVWGLDVVPVHTIKKCIAYYNRNKGFYANHHLGGINWLNNSAYLNPSNYCMLNRVSSEICKDTVGYGHVLHNNVSFNPRSVGKHIIDIDWSRCESVNNSFNLGTLPPVADDFLSIDPLWLVSSRNADGSLPETPFLKARRESRIGKSGMGYAIEAAYY